MKPLLIALTLLLLTGVSTALPAAENEFTRREAKIRQYKKWLDALGPRGSRYWTRLDSRRRPHRLYVAEGFHRADFQSQELFVNTFSNFLAGHPEKFMLIDLFDTQSGRPVGEYGFGGFKLYAKPSTNAFAPPR